MQYGALGFLQKPVSAEGLQAGLSGIHEFVEKRVKNLLVVEDDPVQSQAIADLIGDGDVSTTSVALFPTMMPTLGTRPTLKSGIR